MPTERLRRRSVIRAESTGRRVLEQSRIRLLCVGAIFMVSFTTIGVRLIEVSVFRNSGGQTQSAQALDENAMPDEEALAQAQGDADQLQVLELSRNDIVDRNGVLIATSLPVASLFANPHQISNPVVAAQKLAKALPEFSEKTLKKKLSRNTSFVWVKRNLTPREQQRINTLGIPGLYFLPEEKRVYPYGRLFSHALGYVGQDNVGLAGIERYFDEQLRDTDGDAMKPLELSLDVQLQGIVREELANGMKEFQAIGATGIVMDLEGGEILAMANLPDFDPHQPGRAKAETRFNRASLGTYEMGSTFKTFTMAMALENGVATMSSGYDATNPIRVAGYTINDSHPKARWLTVPEIYAYSSNIGTAKMALDVGAKRQKEFLGSLGMFDPIEIELPERSKPLVPNTWREINLMTVSYGHGIAVSPLHLVRGIATVVGDGTLAQPTLIRDGNKEKAKAAAVVKETTVRDLRRLMRLVVEYGTGGKADVPGYRVGGKTGTAEKIAGKGYDADAKMALFVSAFPVDSPRYVMLVMLDEPKGNESTFGYATGGWTSAPVAGRIIARMGPLYGIRPIFDVAADDADKFWRDTPAKKAKSTQNVGYVIPAAGRASDASY